MIKLHFLQTILHFGELRMDKNSKVIEKITQLVDNNLAHFHGPCQSYHPRFLPCIEDNTSIPIILSVRFPINTVQLVQRKAKAERRDYERIMAIVC